MADDVEFSPQQKLMAVGSVILIAACVAFWVFVPMGKQRPKFDDQGPTHVDSAQNAGKSFSINSKPPEGKKKS